MSHDPEIGIKSSYAKIAARLKTLAQDGWLKRLSAVRHRSDSARLTQRLQFCAARMQVRLEPENPAVLMQSSAGAVPWKQT